MNRCFQPQSFLKYLNPDGGFPYAPGISSFSEPTLLMLLAFIAADETLQAKPLVEWVLKNRNPDGSIGLNREFPNEGLWNSPLLATAMHQLGRKAERDSAIDFILKFRSIPVGLTPENKANTLLVGWSWVPQTFGWVEPTSWALLALALAGKADHARAIEGRLLLEDRCLPEGGWNYGNKIMFNNALLPFWETTALAQMALGRSNADLLKKNLDLLERSLPEMHSLLTHAWTCLCLAEFGIKTERIQTRICGMLANTGGDATNLAHSALGLMALSGKKVLTP